jgi:hypothetical protein
MVSNSIHSIPNFVKFSEVVEKLKEEITEHGSLITLLSFCRKGKSAKIVK